MGEFIDAEKKFNNKREQEKLNSKTEKDIENILGMSPHYDGMPEKEKKALIEKIVGYIEDKEADKNEEAA